MLPYMYIYNFFTYFKGPRTHGATTYTSAERWATPYIYIYVKYMHIKYIYVHTYVKPIVGGAPPHWRSKLAWRQVCALATAGPTCLTNVAS